MLSDLSAHNEPSGRSRVPSPLHESEEYNDEFEDGDSPPAAAELSATYSSLGFLDIL